ncbi:DinB family protein [Chitinophaga lutea]
MKAQLLKTLANSRDYTLRVAESMPANGYGFKPDGAGWNFGELLSHIAYGIGWWKDNFLLGKETPWEQPEPAASKKAAIQSLTAAYADLQQAIGKLPLTDESVSGFYATNDHITHHRGQAVIYLRGKGITPPEYSF